VHQFNLTVSPESAFILLGYVVGQELISFLFNRVRTLAIILQDVDVQQPDLDIDDRHRNQLGQISHSCWTLLKELEVAIGKYKVIEYCGTSLHKKARSIWKRISWEPKEITDLRDRLISNVTLLQAYLNAISRYSLLSLPLPRIPNNCLTSIAKLWLQQEQPWSGSTSDKKAMKIVSFSTG
jgi:hypothetical protein